MDDAEGLVKAYTPMQAVAAEYFDDVAKRFHFSDAKENGADIFVAGHSKGGNEARFINMAAGHKDLIDGCCSSVSGFAA